MQVVDLMKGEHMGPDYGAIIRRRQVPLLEEGDWRLPESSAILKYLASRFDCPEYPKDLKQRAKVDAAMDWINTMLYRDFGYGLLYPQIFPHHKRPTDEQHKGTIAWGKEKCKTAFAILDRDILGKNDYLANNHDLDRRLFRRLHRHRRRADRLRVQGLSEREALDRQHAEAEELGQRQRSDVRLRRVAEGPAVRDRLS